MNYQVNLEKFIGPLDLLLSLIEEKKLAINDISLSRVTDQFLEYLKNLENENETATEYKRILADFLVIASRLILIKSYSLLPNLVLTVEEEEDIKDLENRLKAYQEIRAIAKVMGRWGETRVPYFSREFYLNLPTAFYPPQSVTAADLGNIYKLFLETLPKIEKLEEQSIKKIATIEEKIRELTVRIGLAAEASFADVSGGINSATGRINSKIDVILTFLALLMLFRKRILYASQDKIFGDIKIKPLS